MSAAFNHKTELSGMLIKTVSEIVSKITGVQLGEKQMHMVSSRVRKRIDILGLKSEEAYLSYLKLNAKTETTALVSLLTTHHTYFFREFSHFEYIEKTVLPDLINEKRKNGDKTIRIWSAACSHGQEVYSLSIFIGNLLKRIAPEFNFEILGTDVDPESVEVARNGVYHKKEMQEIPLALIGGNFLQGTGEIENYVKVTDLVKKNCHFEAVNLLEIPETIKSKKFDIVFCRNVFIYFSQEQIASITKNLIKSLDKSGFFFIGISESLHGLNLGLRFVGPSIYRHEDTIAQISKKIGNQLSANSLPSSSLERNAKTAGLVVVKNTGASLPAASAEKIIRVLCVDDSPTILALMKKILTKEYGFEVIDTAKDGLDAAEKIKGKTYDIMTLDIHMPNQNGIEFLKNNPKRPPVVVVSSVSRDDAELALKCLELGASDYVEKPAMSNLQERSDEIRLKIKYAIDNANKNSLNIEKSFRKDSLVIKSPERKIKVFIVSFSNVKKLMQLLQEKTIAINPSIVLIENAGQSIYILEAKLKKENLSRNIISLSEFENRTLSPNDLILMDTKNFLKVLSQSKSFDRVAFGIVGSITKGLAQQINQLENKYVLIDDSSSASTRDILGGTAADSVPVTSFHYLMDKFFAE